MTVEEVTQKLKKLLDGKLECIAGTGGLRRTITGVYMGDLLSVAMANAKEGEIWLTVQGHLNVIAVATLVNIPAIILVQGSVASEEMKQKAEDEQIVILTTNKRSYEVALALSQCL